MLWEGGPAELAEAVRSFDDAAVDPQACVRSANRFGADVFRRELPREVKAAIAESAAEPHEGARRELRHARRRAAFGPRRPSGIG